jgi:hypothetical protein
MFKNGNGSKKYVESESREARMLVDAQQKVLNSTQWLTAEQLSIFTVCKCIDLQVVSRGFN